MQLDIAVLTGGDGRLEGKGSFCVDIGGLSRYQSCRRGGVHVGRVELGHHNAICPGRVGDGQPEDPILETGPGVDRREPIKRLVSLLVGVAVSPVNRLFLYFYRPGLYLHPIGVAGALACY